jgi:hypothetical protein
VSFLKKPFFLSAATIRYEEEKKMMEQLTTTSHDPNRGE